MFTKTKSIQYFRTLVTFMLCMIGAPVKFWLLAAIHFVVYAYGVHVESSFVRTSDNVTMVLWLIHTAGWLWIITGCCWGLIAFLANKDTLLTKDNQHA